MPDLTVTIVMPSGGARVAEIPDDVSVHDLLTELTSLLKLPTVGPDGRPMYYRLDSKALGRELKDEETLNSAAYRKTIAMMLNGGHYGWSDRPGPESRMRRLRVDYELMQELVLPAAI